MPRITQQRQLVIDWLNSRNGVVTPDYYDAGYSYLERDELIEDSGWQGSASAWTALLSKMEEEKFLDREIDGRRLKSITLRKRYRKELEPTPPPEEESTVVEPDVDDLVDEVARRLLDRVVEAAQRPFEKQRVLEELELEHEQLKGRLGEQTALNEKLRRDLLDANDTITGLRDRENRLMIQVDWFREQWKKIGKHLPEPVQDETRREIDRMMREVPRNK